MKMLRRLPNRKKDEEEIPRWEEESSETSRSKERREKQKRREIGMEEKYGARITGTNAYNYVSYKRTLENIIHCRKQPVQHAVSN